MGIVAFLVSLFTAIADTRALAEYAKAFALAILKQYLANEESDTLTALADAAALGARAQTKEDRYANAQKWHDAMSRPRITG